MFLKQSFLFRAVIKNEIDISFSARSFIKMGKGNKKVSYLWI